MFTQELVKKYVDRYLEEDGIFSNLHYLSRLENKNVQCHLKIKSDLCLAGLPVFFECFNAYLPESKKIDYKLFKEYEGQFFKKEDKKELKFSLPFETALTLERIALNLLNRISSIATTTKAFKEKLKEDIAILDTRKTTPGLRAFEKYGVRIGGGKNHRFSQLDAFMIKDNHKNIFDGLKGAISFFQTMQSFYTPLIVEIHDLNELKVAIDCGVRHVMLDNFPIDEIHKAIAIKLSGITYEVSGGITLDNVQDYDINGIDALSVGMVTQSPQKVDLSLKYYNL